MMPWAILFFVGFTSFAQNKSTDNARASIPSKEEISELLSKADEKISSFEQSMKSEKPTLDAIDSSLTSKGLDAASTVSVRPTQVSFGKRPSGLG